jgi:hypothetical protein
VTRATAPGAAMLLARRVESRSAAGAGAEIALQADQAADD